MNRIGAPGAALIASLLLSAAAVPARDADQALRRAVVSACLKASTLEDARTVGETIRYDARVGHAALLLTGRRAQPAGGDARGFELCLYDERTGAASVVTADELIGGW